jgi:hypothetical protein
MAVPKTVYSNAEPSGVSSTLFDGTKFWLSYNVPQRTRFIEAIQVRIPSLLLQEIDSESISVTQIH